MRAVGEIDCCDAARRLVVLPEFECCGVGDVSLAFHIVVQEVQTLQHNTTQVLVSVASATWQLTHNLCMRNVQQCERVVLHGLQWRFSCSGWTHAAPQHHNLQILE